MVAPPIFAEFDSPELQYRFFDDVSYFVGSALIERFRPPIYEFSGSVRASADHAIRSELTRVISQCVCVELALSRLGGLLVGEEGRTRYASFFGSAASSQFVDYLLAKYPVLHDKVSSLVGRTYDLFEYVTSALDRDRAALKERFDLEPTVKLSHVIPLGDAHHGGRRACKLVFEGGSAVMYKPRSSLPEQMMSELAATLGEPVSGWLGIGQCLEREGYHWQEWLDVGASPGVRDDEYYQAAGAWLAFSYYTATRDLHFENLIAVRDGLWAVDLECAFNSVATDPEQPLSFRQARFDSVFSAAILPMRVGASMYVAGQNLGAIGGMSEDESGLPRMELTDDGTDMVAIRRTFGQLQDPRDEGMVGETLANAGSIRIGFDLACERIRGQIGRFREAVDSSSVVTRVVVRPTVRYFEAIMKSHHPAAMVDRATCLNVLGENLRNDAPYGDDSFVEAESKSMYLLDIPVYYTSPANSALPGAGDDIPLLSGRDAVRRRLDELSDGGDAERHYDTIAKSLAAYGSSVRSDAHDTVERSALLVGNADAEMAKYAVEQITESIRQSRSARNPSSWLNATRGETNRWFLATSDHGLYNGSAGIFLGMANAHLFTQSDSARALAEELFADLVNVSNATQLRDVGVGAYGGISGIAYALAAGTQLGYDRDERAAEAIHRLSEICRDKLEKPEESDVISGAAGCLLVNAELLRVGLVDRLLGVDVCNAAVAALLHLAESGPEVESLTWPDSWSKTWLGGLSHGVAGVEWAATRYGRLQLGEPSLVAALRRGARLSQDSLLSDDPYLWADRRPPEVIGNPPMQAWCHGSEGIILGRLDSGSIDLLTDDELSTMASRLVGLPITTNPCICHGMAGRLIALDEMDRALRSRAIVRPDIVGLVGALEGALLDIAMKQRTLNDSSIELWNEGLMIGRSGMLWILSRISLPASQLEPSLLRLSSGP